MTLTLKANEPMTGTPADSRVLPAPPDILTGKLFDFNADTLGAVGATVTSFASSSGSVTGLTLNTNSSGNWPSVANGPAGHKALSFDGVNDWIRSADASLAQGTPLTFAFLVYVPTGLTGTGRLLTGTSTAYAGVRIDLATGIVRVGVNVDYQLTGGAIPLGEWVSLIVVFDGAATTIQINREVPTVGNTTAAVTITRLMFGTNTGATGTWFNGMWSRTVGFSRALSSADRRQIVDDMNAKFGLTL